MNIYHPTPNVGERSISRLDLSFYKFHWDILWFLRNHQKEARNAVIGWHSDVNEMKRENIWIFRNFKTLNNDDSDCNCWYFHITHLLDTVLNTLYIISLNPQNILGYRYYYHSHFLFKATLGLREVRCRVRWQRQDLNPGHSAPEFAVHDLASPLVSFNLWRSHSEALSQTSNQNSKTSGPTSSTWHNQEGGK